LSYQAGAVSVQPLTTTSGKPEVSEGQPAWLTSQDR